jgi:hypothetical protein
MQLHNKQKNRHMLSLNYEIIGIIGSGICSVKTITVKIISIISLGCITGITGNIGNAGSTGNIDNAQANLG